MKIHEYQAKEILHRFAVPVPKGIACFSIDEAEAAAKQIIAETGGDVVVVKAQIHAGGRGKGGGVKVVKGAATARETAQKILGMTLVTHQTGPEGKLVKRLLSGETVTHEGPIYRLGEARVWPQPVQQPHPPIIMGGGGPRMLRLAAREADIVGFIPQFSEHGRPMLADATESALDRKVAMVREAAGERLAGLELNLFIADAGLIGSGQPVGGSVLAAAKSATVGLVGSPYLLYGTLAQLRDLLERRRERTGISYYSIRQSSMEAMAPLVAALSGR